MRLKHRLLITWTTEFGDSRRLHNGVKPANAFCFHCGDSLWTKSVLHRYDSFKEWAKHEKRVMHSIHQKESSIVCSNSIGTRKASYCDWNA